MKCPTCEVPLVMTERSGVEIDYCPQCRGVWLDRGELDKIIERTAQSMQTPAAPSNPTPPAPAPAPTPTFQPHPQPQYHPKGGHYYGKKKKSFLDDIFDF
jgi:Zn-finger nucleic acid-binding protein